MSDDIPDIEIDRISEMTSDDLYNTKNLKMIINADDAFRSKLLEAKMIEQAKKLHIAKEFSEVLKAYKIKTAAMRQDIPTGNKTKFMDQPIELSCGDWVCDMSGVKKKVYSSNSGMYEAKWASPIPLLVTEILENVDEKLEKIRIAYYKNGWYSILCNRSTVASNTKIIELADKGIEVNSDNAKLLVKYIADLVALNLGVIPRYKAVTKMGWVDDTEFMPYSGYKFDGENEFKYLYESICPKGDIDKWTEYTHELRKNKYLRLQMGASFASPILKKIGALPFVLHLWGGTEAGKTVGMFVAMSIWGNPTLGRLTRTMNMTPNSMVKTSSVLNNIPFAGDELQTIKSYCGYDALIMQICEGVGRGRMKYDALEKSQTWNCTFLFTGEENCVRENSGGGAINRVISVECTGKVVENGNEVTNFVSKNYGLIGEKFIKCLENENLKEQYNQIFKDILNKTDTTDKQAMAMACIMLGDRMACKYIYKGETPLSVDDVKEFLVSKRDVDVSERAYEFVLNLIALNQNKFSNANLSGELWGKIEGDTVLINKTVLVREMRNANFEFDAVKNRWAEKGLIIRNSQWKLVHQTKCYGVKSSYIKIQMRDDMRIENIEDVFPE